MDEEIKNENNDQKQNFKLVIKKFVVIFVFCGSLILNGIFLLNYVYPRISNYINNDKGVSVSNYDYNTNYQYSARLTQFQLYDGKTDIVFAGDSITEKGNWNELFAGINCIDRGIGSDTTEGLLNRLDEIMKHDPEKIFILIGINDLSVGISADEICSNMSLIVEKISEMSPNTRIYIESVLPAKDIEQGQIDMINKIYESICAENISATYIDISPVFNMQGGGYYYSGDGIHLNGEGYKEIVQRISKYVYE